MLLTMLFQQERKLTVIMASQLQTEFRPLIKVLSGGDSTSDSLLGADRPVLLKGRRANNRRLIDTSTSIHCISSFIDREVAFFSPWFVRQQVSMCIHDVVFDERVPSPAIYSQIAGAFRCVVAGVRNSSRESRQQTCAFYNILINIKKNTDLLPPGLHPFPHTKPLEPPLLCQVTLYEPPAPLLHRKVPPPSDQEDQK